MAYERREFSGVAVATTLSGSVNSGDTTIIVADATGWPSGSDDFFLVIDRGTASEEKCRATGRTGTSITVTRGADGTTAVAHDTGAAVEHCLAALDLDEANAHLSNQQADPHPMYLTSTEADADYQPLDADLTTIAGLSRTKGDLLVGGATAWTDKAVGTNGQVLEADSAEADGLKWVGDKEVIIVAVSDETTAITTGTAKVTFRMPFAMTLTAVRASLSTASSSGTPTFDINEGGSTILSTKLTIDANEKTSTTAAAAAVISDASLADDAEITVDIDVAGTGAKGAKVALIGRRT